MHGPRYNLTLLNFSNYYKNNSRATLAPLYVENLTVYLNLGWIFKLCQVATSTPALS